MESVVRVCNFDCPAKRWVSFSNKKLKKVETWVSKVYLLSCLKGTAISENLKKVITLVKKNNNEVIFVKCKKNVTLKSGVCVIRSQLLACVNDLYLLTSDC